MSDHHLVFYNFPFLLPSYYLVSKHAWSTSLWHSVVKINVMLLNQIFSAYIYLDFESNLDYFKSFLFCSFRFRVWSGCILSFFIMVYVLYHVCANSFITGNTLHLKLFSYHIAPLQHFIFECYEKYCCCKIPSTRIKFIPV